MSAPQTIPLPEVATTCGVRVLMLDRPGYGSSPADPGASLLDVAEIVHTELDRLGVGRFFALGWSGGGPHALASAALAPERVKGVGLFASWSPMNPPDPGLPTGVRLAMRAAAVLPRPAVRAMFALGRQRGIGMVDDVRRVAGPWPFDVSRVASVLPVVAWHAKDDHQVPIAPWRKFPGVCLRVLPGDSHDVAAAAWEEALRLVADRG